MVPGLPDTSPFVPRLRLDVPERVIAEWRYLMARIAVIPSRRRLLIVEDDMAVIFALREFFAVGDYDVDCAAGPTEARNLLAQNAYDVLITDLHLTPNRQSEGLGVLRFAQICAPQMCKVMLTGFSSDGIAQTARQMGASAVLAKPVEPPELAAVVVTILNEAGYDGRTGDPRNGRAAFWRL